MSDHTPDSAPLPEGKRCCVCKEIKPYQDFAKDNGRKDGYQRTCKVCRRNRYVANREGVLNYSKSYYRNNKTKIRERIEIYRKSNLEKHRGYVAKWRLGNPEKVKKQKSRHYKKHSGRYITLAVLRRKRNPEKYKVIENRRRARKLNLPDTWTQKHWQFALNYFNGCCAVCGRQLTNLLNTHKPAADHWIPLVNPTCPGTVPENIVPLCHGIGGCNNKKSSKDPEQWLIETYGRRKAKQILDRINQYFETVKNR